MAERAKKLEDEIQKVSFCGNSASCSVKVTSLRITPMPKGVAPCLIGELARSPSCPPPRKRRVVPTLTVPRLDETPPSPPVLLPEWPPTTFSVPQRDSFGGKSVYENLGPLRRAAYRWCPRPPVTGLCLAHVDVILRLDPLRGSPRPWARTSDAAGTAERGDG